MYVANQHRICESDAINFAQKTGVGEFISLFDGKIQATRVPFIVIEENSPKPATKPVFHLETHLSQVNPQWRGENEGEALLVVNVADQHVLGHLLPPEQEFARLPQVPTWDYVTIHLRGKFTAFHDDDWKIAHLKRFVKNFEPVWKMDTHSNYQRLNHALPALVGIRMEISEVIGKAKLHQQLASTQIALLAKKLQDQEENNYIPQLMKDISVPWAKMREERVAFAREQKTLPIVNPARPAESAD